MCIKDTRVPTMPETVTLIYWCKPQATPGSSFLFIDEKPEPQKGKATCQGHTAIKSQLRLTHQLPGSGACAISLSITSFVSVLSEIFYAQASRYFCM